MHVQVMCSKIYADLTFFENILSPPETTTCSNLIVASSPNRENLTKKTSKADAHS